VTAEPTTKIEQAPEQELGGVNEVGEASDQRQGRDIADEKAGDDRRRAVKGFNPETDTGHHVGQREDDDIGVGRREQRRRSRRSRAGGRGAGVLTAVR
jgi:hypothetical protein